MSDWSAVLGPIANAVAPVLGGLIAGPAGAAVGGVLGKALASALGVPDTPEAVGKAIQADQGRAQEVMRQLGLDPALVATLGGVETVELARERLAMEDRKSAREQTMNLAGQGSPIAWGAPAVSFVVTLGFMGLTGALMFRAVPDTQAFLLIVGAMIAAFTQVVAYWLGSSVGSKVKDATLSRIYQDEAAPARADRYANLRPKTGELR